LSFFLVTCPKPPGFARANKYPLRLTLHNIFYTLRGGRTTAGYNALGASLVLLPRRQDGVCHKEKGAEKTWGGGAANTSKVR